jgi:hypothetical protein
VKLTTIPPDTEFLDEALRLLRAFNADRATAQKYMMIWLVIFAMWEETIPSDVLDKLVRTQPSRRDQYSLVNRLRRLMFEAA